MPRKRKPLATQPYEARVAAGVSRGVALSLDAAWLGRLDALAARLGVSRSEVVRRAVAALEAHLGAAEREA